MGSAKSIAGATQYTDHSWYTGSARGTVKVGSCRIGIALGMGVHHCIIVDCPSMDKWVVYEWSADGAEYYACSSIGGKYCLTLGEHTLDEVYAAAQAASHGATYGTRYNCNHWTEEVARQLGYNIEVHWNCSCVVH